MASKSAAAYRQAPAKETPAATDHSAHTMTPDVHVEHGIATDHAAHAQRGVAHDAHAGMQHGAGVELTMRAVAL